MKKSHILVAKMKPGLTREPVCWQFCVSKDGAFEYTEAEGWSVEDSPIIRSVEGKLTESELASIKHITSTLDESSPEIMTIHDSGVFDFTYRRPDGTVGTVDRGGIAEIEGDAFDFARTTIHEIMVANGLD